MKIKTLLFCITATLCGTLTANAADAVEGLSASIAIKKPGNKAVSHTLNFIRQEVETDAYTLQASDGELPLNIVQTVSNDGSRRRITVSLTAHSRVYFNFKERLSTGFSHDDCLFYMPGFWYRRNLRSPKQAPSFHTSDSWTVREDRLSTPLVAAFSQKAHRAVFDSYLRYGFSFAGYFNEVIDCKKGKAQTWHSIRRQSEGVCAVLYYLDYERRNGRLHPEWEQRMKSILDLIVRRQKADGSFPRKFNDDGRVVDAGGGSTPSATLPLVMGSRYFGNHRWLMAARRTMDYIEKKIITPSDYFSSTLDADCEDKEASLYSATAAYCMALSSHGSQRRHYAELCRQAAYFALSWYYTWDVPFAQGQMLGDIGLKTRGWGNVSVENNHIDVFVFDFVDVLKWLSHEFKEPRFMAFSNVISTSIRQILPCEGNLCGVAKVGYYPEVVQHTHWDYGRNGKGFYNDIFAPGWTVASLWEMLTLGRAARLIER